MKALKPAKQEPQRYIVLEAKQPQQHRTVNDWLKIYFVFDTQTDNWADCSENKVRWYSEDQAAVAYARASELNALHQQLETTEDSRHSVYCCQLAPICIMCDRPIEHTNACQSRLNQGDNHV